MKTMKNTIMCCLVTLWLLVGVPAWSVPTSGVDGVKLETYMKNGGWCWFQDPRAICHDGKLFIGGIHGQGKGEAVVGVYDLDQGKILGRVVLNPEFDHDDHNAPVFHVRPDGRILAIYARHHRDRFHYLRVSEASNPLQWGDEVRVERKMPNPKDRVTYMNLFEQKKQQRLYCFFRGIEYNPTMVWSGDHGETWSEPVHFIRSEVSGRHRPYPRYVGDGKDRIGVSFTDAHPRQYGNSIYYAEFRDGAFYKADGTKIQSLEADGPIRPSAADLVYQGSGKPGGDYNLSAPGAAWTSDIQFDANGHPHIAYSLYHNNQEHDYRIASWNGQRWLDRKVAFAGTCLYDKESSYTGLIALDPEDPHEVVISSNVDPSTGRVAGSGKHEIYRARIEAGDDVSSVKWRPLTAGSKVNNQRPMVLHNGDSRLILWNRGEFRNYADYEMDVVGTVEAK